jgi:hypothetical protein
VTTPADSGEAPPARGGAYDYDGPIAWEYRPELDHDPDPGEVVWAWVAFEDDHRVGKDRPLAVVGRTVDRRLVGLMLTSRNRDGENGWLAIGAGPWDGRGRPSWVRLDRPLAVAPDAVRREGAVLPRSTYDRIQRTMAALSGAPAGPAPTVGAAPRAVRRGRLGALVTRIGAAVRRRPPAS